MKRIFLVHPWKVIQNDIHREDFRLAESMTSLGNGHMGLRGNFEETYSGDSHQGTYVGGVYYPDKTRVGWWKNGYPEYFAKVLNAPNFIGIKVFINGLELDLAKCEVKEFNRVLDMKNGILSRSFIAIDKNGNETKVETQRFVSIVDVELAAIEYAVTPMNYDGKVTFEPFIDGEVRNEDSNYEEDFWMPITTEVDNKQASLIMRTHKTEFDVAVTMNCHVVGSNVELTGTSNEAEFVSHTYEVEITSGQTATIYKYVSVTTSRDYEKNELLNKSKHMSSEALTLGFNSLKDAHTNGWLSRWENADIEIEGDDEAQQGIRFNMFQLFSTYYGEDARLNIGPKGFTGEKYGGSTYWDTEAYCLPLYLATTDPQISRNLLTYRHKHLPQAKINAGRQGLAGALYPMVTMDGIESHNEWEITFEEIHRNGAIAYAIYNYTNYTGDYDYIREYGFEVLTEISRFWADRVHYHKKKDVYMMHGVTGPNEYENNINNNWYTNVIARWTLRYTLEALERISKTHPRHAHELLMGLNITEVELSKWSEIVEKMYLPYDKELDVFVQHDGFLDKELLTVDDLTPEDRPLCQKWSWDRILRSCFIKQADVLQGIYFFGNEYSLEEKKRNFDFYEPMTVHESSLSPSIYSIIAAEVGYEKKAHELYLRTARLDLDNYNNDTEDGLHITSMSGSWLSIVQGFAGMRTWDEELSFDPFIPEAWDKYAFKILYRGHAIKVSVNSDSVTITQEGNSELEVVLYGEKHTIQSGSSVTVATRSTEN